MVGMTKRITLSKTTTFDGETSHIRNQCQISDALRKQDLALRPAGDIGSAQNTKRNAENY